MYCFGPLCRSSAGCDSNDGPRTVLFIKIRFTRDTQGVHFQSILVLFGPFQSKNQFISVHFYGNQNFCVINQKICVFGMVARDSSGIPIHFIGHSLTVLPDGAQIPRRTSASASRILLGKGTGIQPHGLFTRAQVSQPVGRTTLPYALLFNSPKGRFSRSCRA